MTPVTNALTRPYSSCRFTNWRNSITYTLTVLLLEEWIHHCNTDQAITNTQWKCHCTLELCGLSFLIHGLAYSSTQLNWHGIHGTSETFTMSLPKTKMNISNTVWHVGVYIFVWNSTVWVTLYCHRYSIHDFLEDPVTWLRNMMMVGEEVNDMMIMMRTRTLSSFSCYEFQKLHRKLT